MEPTLFKEDNLYGILARVLGLSQKDDNLFGDKDGKRFILTKYGFWPSVPDNITVTHAKQKKEIDTLVNEDKLHKQETALLLKQNEELANKLLISETENKRWQKTKLVKQTQAEQLHKGDTLTSVLNNVQANLIVKLKSEILKQRNENENIRKAITRLKNENVILLEYNSALKKQSRKNEVPKPSDNNAKPSSDSETKTLKKKIENYVIEIRNLRNLLAKSGNEELLKKIEILKNELTKNQRNIWKDRLLMKEESLPEKTNEEILSDNGLDLFQEQNSQYIGYRYKEQLTFIIENDDLSDEEKINSLSEYIRKK